MKTIRIAILNLIDLSMSCQLVYDVTHAAKFSHACVDESGSRSHIEKIMKTAPNKKGWLSFLLRHVSAMTSKSVKTVGTPKNQSGPKLSINPPGKRANAGGRKFIIVSKIRRL